MGTPDFALESLQAIYEAGFDICGVYTQPDKPAKRGMKLTASPVKLYALEKGLPVFQPAKLQPVRVGVVSLSVRAMLCSFCWGAGAPSPPFASKVIS